MILVQLARKILPFYCHLDIYMNLFLYTFYLILMFCKKKKKTILEHNSTFTVNRSRN